MKLTLWLIYIIIIVLGSFLGTSVFAGGVATYLCGFITGTISSIFLRILLDS